MAIVVLKSIYIGFGRLFLSIGALLALYNVNIERKISLKWALICYVIPWLSFNIGKVVIATFEDESGPTKLFSLDVKIVLYKLSLPFGVCSIWFLYDHIVEGLESFYAEKKATTIVDGKIVQVPTITTKWFNKMLRAVTPYTLWIYCAHEPVMGYLFEILQPFLGLCKMINVGVTSNSIQTWYKDANIPQIQFGFYYFTYLHLLYGYVFLYFLARR